MKRRLRLGLSALSLLAAAPAAAQPSQVDSEFYRLQAMAQRGDAEAQYLLGLRYDRGGFSMPDYVEALSWYRRAAAQNHRDAAFALGLMYLRAEGVQQNYREADAWMARAEALGHAGATAIREQIQPLIPVPVPPPPPPLQPTRFDIARIKQLQTDLLGLGHDPGPIDGIVGTKTRAAIQAFEGKAGLRVSGIPTDALLKAIDAARGGASAPAPLPAAAAPAAPVAAVPGPVTPAASRPPAAAPAPRRQPISFDVGRIKAVQTDLKALGYDPGPIDGVVGLKTRITIQIVEERAKLPVTGRPTEALLTAIEAAKAGTGPGRN